MASNIAHNAHKSASLKERPKSVWGL